MSPRDGLWSTDLVPHQTKIIRKMQSTQTAIEMSWLGINRLKKTRIVVIRKKTGVDDIAYRVKKLK